MLSRTDRDHHSENHIAWSIVCQVLNLLEILGPLILNQKSLLITFDLTNLDSPDLDRADIGLISRSISDKCFIEVSFPLAWIFVSKISCRYDTTFARVCGYFFLCDGRVEIVMQLRRLCGRDDGSKLKRTVLGDIKCGQRYPCVIWDHDFLDDDISSRDFAVLPD